MKIMPVLMGQPILFMKHGDVVVRGPDTVISLHALVWSFCNLSLLVLGVESFQFAYKAGMSTTQCTWAAREVISYYNNKGSNVYCCLLDCSKSIWSN